MARENTAYAYQKFKELCEFNNMTSYQVSQKSEGKISTAALTQWKKGEYNFKLEKLMVLASIFNVPVTVFIE